MMGLQPNLTGLPLGGQQPLGAFGAQTYGQQPGAQTFGQQPGAQSLQFIPYQLQQLQQVQLLQHQQLQQLLQVVPAQLQQIQQAIQFIAQQIPSLQQSGQSPWSSLQATGGIGVPLQQPFGAGFGQPGPVM
jgi:hypothetical protein